MSMMSLTGGLIVIYVMGLMSVIGVLRVIDISEIVKIKLVVTIYLFLISNCPVDLQI